MLDAAGVVGKTALAPSRIFNIVECDDLREGWFADLVLIDMHKQHSVRHEDVLYQCGWSPLEGDTLRSSISQTIVNGQLCYVDGQAQGGAVGRCLALDL